MLEERGTEGAFLDVFLNSLGTLGFKGQSCWMWVSGNAVLVDGSKWFPVV